LSVVWRKSAVRDIRRISAYIALENPLAAQRVLRELVVAGDSLGTFPLRGRRGLAPGTRELVTLQPYIIVYRVLPEGVVRILRVWHAAQDR